MISMKDMKYKVAMAPTPEQQAALKRMMDERMRAQGLTPGDGFWCEERVLTVDEALEMFTNLKRMQDMQS